MQASCSSCRSSKQAKTTGDRLLDVNLKGPFLLTKSAVAGSQGVWSREHYQHKFHRWRGSKSAARRLLCFEVGA